MAFLENKIPPPLVGVTCAALMWVVATFSSTADSGSTIRYAAIALLLLAGITFAVSGMRNFSRAKTTVNPLKPETASSLVTSGIYQVTRNPMYVGLSLVLCAWATFLGSPWAVVFVIVFILFIQRFQIRPEERALEQLFGEEYLAYKNQVRPWL